MRYTIRGLVQFVLVLLLLGLPLGPSHAEGPDGWF